MKIIDCKSVVRLLAMTLTVVAVGGCAIQQNKPLIPEPIKGYGSANDKGEEGASRGTQEDAPPTQKSMPRLPAATSGYATPYKESLPELRGESVSVNVESMPLPAFINEVYGNILGLSFALTPELQKKSDRVTLRITEPQTPLQMYQLAEQVLSEYGIEINSEAGVLSFDVAKNRKGESLQPPLLISGRTLPDVPISHRPIFQLVQLKAVRTVDVFRWLQDIYRNYDLKIIEDTRRNAVIFVGKESVVSEAVGALEALDRPYMRGQHSARIDPIFIKANKLAERLIQVLAAEGYAATNQLYQGGAVIVLPVPETNMVILFSSDLKLLDHTREWAANLDQAPKGGGDGLYLYSVENTRADNIANTVNQLIGDSSSVPTKQGQAEALGGPKSLVVDDSRNALIFQGEASRWQEILPIIKQLDVPPKQVLVEVTVAEVTLNDQESFGVEWLARAGSTRFGETIRFAPSAESVAGSGITYSILNSAGDSKVALNAFALDSRINILSTPQVLVQSGEEATIDVGTEIPIITSRSENTEFTSGRITEEVQYRKTGVILNVKPVVHSGNRIDLVLSQEVSEALPVAIGAAIQSPSIFNRNIETTLSLTDGGSVLLAGLISRRSTDSDSGIPVLKDLPWVGHIFKAQDKTSDRTEMVVMIVPYVIEDSGAAAAVTRSLMERLELVR